MRMGRESPLGAPTWQEAKDCVHVASKGHATTDWFERVKKDNQRREKMLCCAITNRYIVYILKDNFENRYIHRAQAIFGRRGFHVQVDGAHDKGSFVHEVEGKDAIKGILMCWGANSRVR